MVRRWSGDCVCDVHRMEINRGSYRPSVRICFSFRFINARPFSNLRSESYAVILIYSIQKGHETNYTQNTSKEPWFRSHKTQDRETKNLYQKLLFRFF